MTGASQYRLKGQHADTSETRKLTLVEQGAVTKKNFYEVFHLHLLSGCPRPYKLISLFSGCAGEVPM